MTARRRVASSHRCSCLAGPRFRACEVAREAARKAIAGAGGVEDIFQQVPRHHEVRAFAEEQRAKLPALDHQGVRPHGDNFRQRRGANCFHPRASAPRYR